MNLTTRGVTMLLVMTVSCLSAMGAGCASPAVGSQIAEEAQEVPVHLSYPEDPLPRIGGGRGFLEVTNKSRRELVLSASVQVTKENTRYHAPKLVLDPGQTQRVEFADHRNWVGTIHPLKPFKSGDVVRIESVGFKPLEQPVP